MTNNIKQALYLTIDSLFFCLKYCNIIIKALKRGSPMTKNMLVLATERYKKLPAWLMTIIACLLVLFFLLLGELSASLLLALVALVAAVMQGGDTATFFETVTLFDNIYIMLAIAGAPAIILFFWLRWYEKRPFSSLGFFKKSWFAEIIKGWMIGMFLLSVSLLVSYLLGGLKLVSIDFSLQTILKVLIIIPFWFVQGGTEELLTRGWLLPLINKRTNLIFALVLTSSLFGILHLGNDHVTFLSILSITLSGLLMALYMLKTDNIWGAAGLHGAWNFTQGNIFGVAVSGTDAGASLFKFAVKPDSAQWISGGMFGTEGSLIASIVLMIGILVLLKQLRQEKLQK